MRNAVGKLEYGKKKLPNKVKIYRRVAIGIVYLAIGNKYIGLVTIRLRKNTIKSLKSLPLSKT